MVSPPFERGSSPVRGEATLPPASAARLVIGLMSTILAVCPLGAQTSPRGVPADRLDHLPARPARRHGLPRPRAPRPSRIAIRSFVLRTVIVSGSSLSATQLAPAYRRLLGHVVDDPALSSITAALASAYERSDIALYTVSVPEQGFEDGVLRLAVIEGHVSRVEIKGRVGGPTARLLRAYTRRLQQDRPLRRSTLQRVLSLIRDMPGVTATPSFEPDDAQGGVVLVLPVGATRLQIGAGINDRGTAFLGRTQIQADAFLNGVLAGGDQLRATVLSPAGHRRFRLYAGAYSAPLDADGTVIAANLSFLRTRPAGLPLTGDAVSFGMQLTRTIVRRYDASLSVSVGIDGIDTRNALLGLALSSDRVRALRLATAYTVLGERNQLTLSTTASLGLDLLGARVIPGQSDGRFRKIDARVADSQQIGRRLVLRIDAFGQATGDDLPPSEQLALGGDEFGRAYEGALIAGDGGYAGSAELAWVPEKGLPASLAGSELYLYADGGRVSYRSRYGLGAASSHLASLGGGVRLHIAGRTTVQAEIVRGLSDPLDDGRRERARIRFAIKSVL